MNSKTSPYECFYRRSTILHPGPYHQNFLHGNKLAFSLQIRNIRANSSRSKSWRKHREERAGTKLRRALAGRIISGQYRYSRERIAADRYLRQGTRGNITWPRRSSLIPRDRVGVKARGSRPPESISNGQLDRRCLLSPYPECPVNGRAVKREHRSLFAYALLRPSACSSFGVQWMGIRRKSPGKTDCLGDFVSLVRVSYCYASLIIVREREEYYEY